MLFPPEAPHGTPPSLSTVRLYVLSIPDLLVVHEGTMGGKEIGAPTLTAGLRMALQKNSGWGQELGRDKQAYSGCMQLGNITDRHHTHTAALGGRGSIGSAARWMVPARSTRAGMRGAKRNALRKVEVAGLRNESPVALQLSIYRDPSCSLGRQSLSSHSSQPRRSYSTLYE